MSAPTPRRLLLQLLLVFLRLSLLVYLGLGIVLFLFQKSYLYYPDDQDFTSCPGFSRYQKLTHQGTRFYYLPQSDRALVYYHGNAGSACDRSFLAPELESLGYSLLFVEYSGYSNDPVPPDKSRLLSDANHIADFLRQNGYTQIVAIGTSLGSGLASYHTSLQEVNKLILIAPFDSTLSLARHHYPYYPVRLFFTQNFDNQTWLANYQGQVLILHGIKDQLIPPDFSQKLFTSLTTPAKQRILIPDTGHNDILLHPRTFQAISNFLNQ